MHMFTSFQRRHENRQINANEDEVVTLGASRKLSSCSGCPYKIF